MADARAATAVVWPRRSKAWRSRIAATDAGDDVGATIEQNGPRSAEAPGPRIKANARAATKVVWVAPINSYKTKQLCT